MVNIHKINKIFIFNDFISSHFRIMFLLKYIKVEKSYFFLLQI
jgi:hypothetical protein